MLSAISSAAALAAGSVNERGLYLEQTSTALGQLKITISPTFFRLQNDRAGTVSFASAPDWLVTTYNEHRKIYYAISAPKFTGRFAMWSGSLNRHTLTNMHFVETKTFPYKGTGLNAHLLAAAADNSNRARENEEQIWNPHIEILEDKSLPKLPLQLLCRLYFLPQLEGLPVDCQALVESSYTGSGKKTKDVLRTTLVRIEQVGSAQRKHPDLSAFKKSADEVSFANANNGERLDVKDFTDYMGH
jgi:hypothetical protein